MKICFVQPETDYQIMKNRYALAVTFPQIISDLNLEDTNYCVYIFGKAKCDFELFLKKNRPTHVFVTAITSTFPYAEQIAQICQRHECIVVLGGLFASINYRAIIENFPCFDFIVSGHPDVSLISLVKDKPSTPQHLSFSGSSNYSKGLGNIITDTRFLEYYSGEDTVCYELTNGCIYNCSFCTMRRAFPKRVLCKRPFNVVKADIAQLAQHWKRLKLIDDDIYNSIDLLRGLDLSSFDEVIAETRVDNVSDASIRVFCEAGITHLIVGIESFDEFFLTHSRKTRAADKWCGKICHMIRLCQKYGILMRPVLMITNKFTTLDSLRSLETLLDGWTPENNVELLCSFYTPHPGMGENGDYQGLLTNDLRYFDHLHLVWMPPLIDREKKDEVLEIYSKIVDVTNSHEFNPTLETPVDMKEKYACLFKYQA